MKIKEAIAKLLYDIHIDPAEYRVIFKHQAGEYWDVPFNFINIEGNYFTYNKSTTLYPLYRIVAIYNRRGEFLVCRAYPKDCVTVKPKSIDLVPGIHISAYIDNFTIARYAWLILQHVERLIADGIKDDAIEILGPHQVDKDFIVITDGYFRGTTIYEGKVYRGNMPIPFHTIRDKLSHQRIYVFSPGEICVAHTINDKNVRVTREHCMSTNQHSILPNKDYSIMLLDGLPFAICDNSSKMLLNPSIASNIYTQHHINHRKHRSVVTKEWLYDKNSILLIADYDTILSINE